MIAIALPAGCLVTPAGAQAGLTVLGGSAQRTVFLAEGDPAEQNHTKSKTPVFDTEGLLHLDLRNTAGAPLRLRILYTSALTGTLDVLPRRSTLLSLVPSAPDGGRFARLARQLASHASAISHGSGGAPRNAAGAVALRLGSSLAVAPGRPAHPQVHALAATLYAAVRDRRAAPLLRSRRAAAELGAVVCPPHRRCPLLHGRDVAPLLLALHRVASRAPTTLSALQRALVALAVTLRSRGYVFIYGHTVKQLNLRFRMPENMAPGAVDGTLEIDGYTLRAARLAASMTITVKGQIEPLGDVRFDPSTVVLQVAQGCMLVCGNHSGIVHLYGWGVGRLLATLTPTSSIPGVVVHGKETAVVRLIGLERNPPRADTAIARIELSGTPVSGSYSGTLALSRLLAGSPSLIVQVHSQKWVIWAVLFVFLGVLASGWTFQRFPRARRKYLIRRAVKKIIDELLADCEQLPVNLRDETPLVRDLKRHVDITSEDGWTYYSTVSAGNPASIIAGTRWARDDSDLYEATKATLVFIEQVTRWRKSLAQLGSLWELVEFGHDRQRRTGLHYTTLSKDTRRFMSEVAAGPVTKLDHAKLVERLARQAVWYRKFAEAWELRARLKSAGGLVATEAKLVALETLDAKAKQFWQRPKHERKKFETRLAMLAQSLERLRHKSIQDPDSADVEQAAIPLQTAEARVEDLRSPLPTQERLGNDPQLALSLTAASAAPALDPVPAWEADTHASGATMRELASEVKDSEMATDLSPSPKDRVREYARHSQQRARAYTRRSRFLLWLRLSDGLMSVAIVLVTSLVYTATVYNNDWGTVADCVGAFGAGFAGHVTVNWGLLPIYQSIRLRVGSGASGDSAGGAMPAS